mmetsp:Transcript_12088/g.34608  ORF Transcript_12088/g.34608 Transcript_12088/m.34608 type:complete len:246 (-) Transcript_12088:428-1165(-)
MSPSPAMPRRSKYASTVNMTDQAKMKLLTTENMTPKPFLAFPYSTIMKAPRAAATPTQLKIADWPRLMSCPSGTLPSSFGRTPVSAKRNHCTTRKEIVRPTMSSVVSSISSSQSSSCSSMWPSKIPTRSRMASVNLCRAQSTKKAVGMTRKAPNTLSSKTCWNMHHALIDEKPVMWPSSVAQHFRSNSILPINLSFASGSSGIFRPKEITRDTQARNTCKMSHQQALKTKPMAILPESVLPPKPK